MRARADAARDAAVAPVKRGRPPRLSRGSLLDAALALLERTPRESLTVARVAAEVGAAPAALYRHFASLDDLLDGVLARVLAAARATPVRARASWQAQIRDWMTTLRRELLRYPQVLGLIGRRGRTSPAWLEAVETPLAILERAGLRGARLARAHLWLTETTIALVVQEASLSLPDQLRGAHAALREMPAERRAALSPLLARLESIEADDLFAFVVDRTLVGLTDLVAKR
jgi:AcrR family transcriptional regulator